MDDDIRNNGLWDDIRRNRDFMKCPNLDDDSLQSDQEKKLPQPPLGNAAKGPVVELPAGFETEITCPSYAGLLDARRSERVYDAKTPMTQKQLAFLLWSVQGVQDIRGANYAAMRPVPSGGARHPFELYFTARNVEGLGQGIYHYLPLEHVGEKRAAVEFIGRLDDYGAAVTEMLAGQKWALNAQIVVFFSCAAYRAEWRYSALAHRVVLIDLGHAGQNLMLSATALGLGSCCMAAFDQAFCDKTLGLDGFEEYTVYACAVGKPRR